MGIAEDKIKHFLAGFIIATVATLIFGALWGIIATVVIGASKELIYDKLLKKGTPEVADFLFTLAGGLNALLILGIGYLILR